jgi:hypothetical protein
MKDLCSRMHEPPVPAFPAALVERLQPVCAAGWQLDANLSVGYCEHSSLEDGPRDATQIEESSYHATAYKCSQSNLRGVVVGPFHSAPGAMTSFALPFSPLQHGDRIVAFLGDALDADGSPIGYPPLHMHHMHIGKTFPEGSELAAFPFTHYFETHGDYGVAPDGHQPEQILPPGYCDVYTDHSQVTVDGQMNDVRFQADGAMGSEATGRTASEHSRSKRTEAAPFTWYARVYFRLSEAPCKLASKARDLSPER